MTGSQKNISQQIDNSLLNRFPFLFFFPFVSGEEKRLVWNIKFLKQFLHIYNVKITLAYHQKSNSVMF